MTLLATGLGSLTSIIRPVYYEKWRRKTPAWQAALCAVTTSRTSHVILPGRAANDSVPNIKHWAQWSKNRANESTSLPFFCCPRFSLIALQRALLFVATMDL